MSIEVILKAAEYIERRERGKRPRLAVFVHDTTTVLHTSNAKVSGVKYSVPLCRSVGVFIEAEHGYAMIRPHTAENVSVRRRTSSTPARRIQSTAVAVR